MKKMIVFLVILLSITFNHFSIAAESEYELTLGTIDKIKEEEQDGLLYQYMELTDTQNNLQKIFYTSFEPSDTSHYQMVLHHVEDEQGNFKNATVKEIANDYEAKTGQKVMVAVNGDFFIGATPVDYYVNNGEVLHVGPYDWKNSFGFNYDGSTAIGRVNELGLKLKLAINGENQEFVIDKVNEEPLEGEIAVMTPDRFRSISYKNTAKYLVSLDRNRTADYSLPIGGTAYRLSKGEVVSDDTVSLGSDKVMLVIKGENEISQYFYDNFNYGTRVDVVQTLQGDFQDLNWVIGGYSVLVKDQDLLPRGAHTDNGGNVPAPRTTIGITNDGKYFVSVIDGRNSEHSLGLTVTEQAQLSLDMGAKHALELDGGGSSTFLYRVNDELQVMNQPSDGYLRSVSNAVLIIDTETNEPSPDESDVNEPEPDTDPITEPEQPSDDTDTPDKEPQDNTSTGLSDIPKLITFGTPILFILVIIAIILRKVKRGV
jgi:hypothetical protein